VDITLVTSLLGALGIGGVAGNLLTTWRQRKDKREEREATRDESHRDQLRRAYAEFISAYSKFLDAGGLMHSIGRAIDELPHDTYLSARQLGADEDAARVAAAGAVIPELRERGRRAIEDFVVASADANTHAIAVLIIDDDSERRKRTLVLANSQLAPPQSNDDSSRFHADLVRLRAVLDELTESLGGAFSPDRWYQEVADRRARVAAERRRGALPAGQSRETDVKS
jgi:hypothetical protein